MKEKALITYASLIPLLLWKTSYKISCFSLIIPFLISIIFFFNTFSFKSKIKVCLANCYFNKKSFIYKLFTKKLFIFIFSFISSLILASSLSINIVFANSLEIIILALSIFFILFLHTLFEKENSLNEKIKPLIFNHYISIINAFLLIIVFLIINLYQTPPSYITNDFTETLKNATANISSNCFIIDFIIRLITEIKAFKWWIMINITINSHYKILNTILWVLFLIGNFISYYAFSRYILDILYLTTKDKNATKD
jgi:hypothetical protein